MNMLWTVYGLKLGLMEFVFVNSVCKFIDIGGIISVCYILFYA
jgi:hypothetical protein